MGNQGPAKYYEKGAWPSLRRSFHFPMSQLVDCAGTEIICGNCIALTGDGWDPVHQSEASVGSGGPIRNQGYRSSPPSDDVLWWTLPGNPWHQWPDTLSSQPITAQYQALVTNEEWAENQIGWPPLPLQPRMYLIQVRCFLHIVIRINYSLYEVLITWKYFLSMSFSGVLYYLHNSRVDVISAFQNQFTVHLLPPSLYYLLQYQHH